MKLKKLLVCGLSTIMLFSMSMTAFAASLTADEQKIVDKLTAAGVPAEYVTQASNYLAGNTADVTSTQATDIISKIEAAKTTAGSVTKFADLTADQKNQIASDLTAAGKEIGVTVTFDASANEVKAVDTASGKTILDATLTSASTAATSSSAVIKTTGVNMNTTIAIIAVLAMSLVACGVVVSKKRFAGENA